MASIAVPSPGSTHSGDVFRLLSSKQCIRLCFDGTFKLTKNDFILVTGGLLIKELGKHGYATHYQELAYALVSQESEVCYVDFMSSLRDLVSRVASLDLTRVPQLQIHGDQAGGLEAARKKVFPDSVRVADFAHIIGARRNEGNQDSQAMKVWRSGIFKTVDSHLRQGSYLSLVEFAVYTSRCASPGAFAAIWDSTSKESAATEALRTYWLEERKDGSGYTACWNIHPSRVQPGSGSGSQSQENWHRRQKKRHPKVGSRKLGSASSKLVA